jgi:hypothetical protein
MNKHKLSGCGDHGLRKLLFRNLTGLALVMMLVLFFLIMMNQRVFAAISVLSLYGIPGNQSITVQWETAAEFNLAGFNVFRSTNPSSNFSRINPELISAEGDAFIGDIYAYTDQPLTNGQTYYYLLQIVRVDSSVEEYGPLQATSGSTATSVAPITPTIFATTPTVQTTQTASVTQIGTGIASATATSGSTSIPAQSPTFTPIQSETPAPSVTPSSTPATITSDTITPVFVIDTSATETAIAIAVAADAAGITPQVTSIPETQSPTSRDWIRVGILVVVGAIWVLLGIWMYYYLSRLTK